MTDSRVTKNAHVSDSADAGVPGRNQMGDVSIQTCRRSVYGKVVQKRIGIGSGSSSTSGQHAALLDGGLRCVGGGTSAPPRC